MTLDIEELYEIPPKDPSAYVDLDLDWVHSTYQTDRSPLGYED